MNPSSSPGTVIAIRANLVDVEKRSITASEIQIANGTIQSIRPLPIASEGSTTAERPTNMNLIDHRLGFAIPGFIDAHIHIESSMLVPSEFARMACVHGTVATVSDPHEIANVLGRKGIDFMIENGSQVPLKFCFGAPSCVPATPFETSGATLDAGDVYDLLQRPEIGYLAEVMNYPGVLIGDAEVMAKIEAAKRLQKPVDGHAPGLRGDLATAYAQAGIMTDHECTSLDEALHKISVGMKILIREGSAAKNYEALKSLIQSHPEHVMFCSDDKHPDSLAINHIDELVRRSIADGANVFDVLRVACLNPIEHYRLPVGRLRVGDPADLVIVDNLETFRVRQVFIDGQQVVEDGRSQIDPVSIPVLNQFECLPHRPSDFEVRCPSPAPSVHVNVIEAIDGSLVTARHVDCLPTEAGKVIASAEKDVLKIVVINRYRATLPAVAFIKGFGMKRGAIASSVGHDCHNILAVGVDDRRLCDAVNQVIASRGGIAATDGEKMLHLPLPIAGIMSDRDGAWVADQYQALDEFVKHELGSPLTAPFMTLSFMGLLVIPSLKLSDQGLFDGETFQFVPVIRQGE